MSNYKKLYSLFMFDMPRSIKLILTVVILTWGYAGFKEVEPTLFPVVESFIITDVEQAEEGTSIAGFMNKVRDCKFEQLVAYSGDRLIDIEFGDIRSNIGVSRVEGHQAWGWWMLIPPTDNLRLYARHSCTTGMVLTKLYEGDI